MKKEEKEKSLCPHCKRPWEFHLYHIISDTATFLRCPTPIDYRGRTIDIETNKLLKK